MRELTEILEAVRMRPSDVLALATLVHAEGSTYRRAGARMLIFTDGTSVGAISGGCLEADVVERARRAAAAGAAETVVYDTTSDEDIVWGLGLGCNGVVTVVVDPAGTPAFERRLAEIAALAASRRLVVFGGGHDAVPLTRIARETGWRVTVVDHRPAFARRDRFPAADEVVLCHPAELGGMLRVDDGTAAVLMTHNYLHDVALLEALAETPVRYVGVLGPRRRMERMLGDLASQGVSLSDDFLSRVYGPAGVDIGAEAPEEIALSILAEAHAVLAGRSAGLLRDRPGPIHSREACFAMIREIRDDSRSRAV